MSKKRLTKIKNALKAIPSLYFSIRSVNSQLVEDEYCYFPIQHIGDVVWAIQISNYILSKGSYGRKISLIVPSKLVFLKSYFPLIGRLFAHRSANPGNTILLIFASMGGSLLGHVNLVPIWPKGPETLMSGRNMIDNLSLNIGLDPSNLKDITPVEFSNDKLLEATNFIKSLNSRAKKGILFCPEANTMNSLDKNTVISISKKLVDAGYYIIINSHLDFETKISGMYVVNPTLEKILPLIKTIGSLLSVRSGICDLASLTDAHQVILYPNEESRRLFTFKKYLKNSNLIDEIEIDSFPSISSLTECIVRSFDRFHMAAIR